MTTLLTILPLKYFMPLTLTYFLGENGGQKNHVSQEKEEEKRRGGVLQWQGIELSLLLCWNF